MVVKGNRSCRLSHSKNLQKKHSISYEAVRKQVLRYQDQLGDHVIRYGRQQCLDEWAVEFLEKHRRENPVTAVREDQNDALQQLQEENNRLKNEILKLQSEIIADKEQLSKLQMDNTNLLEAKIRNEYLLEDKTRLQEDVERLRAEVDSFKPSVFGLYRKKK